MYRLSALYPHKRAFITGAASGLGRALCEQLALDRWHIGMCDIDRKGLEEIAQRVENHGGKAFVYELDVADPAQYAQVAEDFLQQAGGIDLLVNNAGISGYVGKMETAPVPDWQWIVGINQMGVVYGCHFFVPTMKKQQSGYILNIASAAGFVNPPNMAGYNVTKAAVISLSESLFTELKPFGVHVSVSMTTFFRTNIMQHSRGNPEMVKQGQKMVQGSNVDAAAMAKQLLNACGQKRFYLLFPFQSRLLFQLKRLSPAFFRWLVGVVTRDKMQR
ncbi:short-chain dehydrogenase [Sphingobacteriales bacterium UPWRP_1]|nr:hypothetical protein BVG80_04765 [Sphingobacteriales bacterium TSM_CSM]PSJ76202.1 short-chain dehydrogenase [Sphingobacteriales bacterium UPWRP_1]